MFFSPGLHVTAGDDSGKIWVYDVGEQLAMPQADEWNKFAYTLQVYSTNKSLRSFPNKIATFLSEFI